MKGIVGNIYEDFVDRGNTGQHILIAGMSGSGKSTILNGIINSILYRKPSEHQMVLIDIKRVEFSKYKGTKHCAKVATSYDEVELALKTISKIIQDRLDKMDKREIDVWDGAILHLIIDELAEIVLRDKKLTDELQSICQLGRAAGIQVICATQCPLASVIPTKIKVNFPIIVGLHTQISQHSRNILEVNGCEKLPMYGEALIMYPTIGIKKRKIPMIPKEQLKAIIAETKGGVAV